MVDSSQLEIELRKNIKQVLIDFNIKKIKKHQKVLIGSKHTYGMTEQRIYELYLEAAKGNILNKLIELKRYSKETDSDSIFTCCDIIQKNLDVMGRCINGLDNLGTAVSKLDKELALYQRTCYKYTNQFL